jgi:hypothetical protein
VNEAISKPVVILPTLRGGLRFLRCQDRCCSREDSICTEELTRATRFWLEECEARAFCCEFCLLGGVLLSDAQEV